MTKCDLDGDLDLAVAQAGAPTVVYRNDAPAVASLRVIPEVGDQPGLAIGAEVVLTVDGVTRRSRIAPTRSYLTQVPAEAWFGLAGLACLGLVRLILSRDLFEHGIVVRSIRIDSCNVHNRVVRDRGDLICCSDM